MQSLESNIPVSATPGIREGQLVLADGSIFEGELFGANLPTSGLVSGEVVFNTVLSGYQEVITDPSYAGQIITFTTPHIGNVGVNTYDFESRRPFCRGVIVRDLARRHSNYRAEASLDAMLTRYGVSAIGGLDTRRLTRVLRDNGSMNGAFGTAATESLHAAAQAETGTAGVDLVAEVTTTERYEFGEGAHTIVAFDFGIKQSILRDLERIGKVIVVPASTTAADVLALRPDGVFLSNGPGDPAELGYAGQALGELIGQVPIFGICLGHQLICRALGADTFKLPFGHHGGNHPVRHNATGKVEITSQNHNFCVDSDALGERATITHVNLNDGTVEGIRVPGQPVFSVQYHPEAGPGPHDAHYLFNMFAELVTGHSAETRPASHSQLIEPELGVA
ncbi:MAG TPA: glutamine-hydrolyzing carbamoyl-phosphate synthase small subunit [Ilumatobacteraceae bacterium]|nr:glutamine-hydrolyzing carbamoyl-phosphate synthase small subunit [Ilumatobacteraceae bacterium]